MNDSSPKTSERLARVETWQENHEIRCEERYAGIQHDVRGLRSTIWKACIALIGALFSGTCMLGFYLVKLLATKVGFPVP